MPLKTVSSVFVLCTFLITLSSVPALARKKYEIVLKDGRSIITAGYCEEAGILYYLKGETIVNIPRLEVLTIRVTEYEPNKDSPLKEFEKCQARCEDKYYACTAYHNRKFSRNVIREEPFPRAYYEYRERCAKIFISCIDNCP